MMLRLCRKRWRTPWLAVLALAIGAALTLVLGRHHGMPDEMIGGLAGSLIGAAAILSGVLFDRRQRRNDEQELQAERRFKLKALITAELVNVAVGAIDTITFADSAVHAATLGHPGPRGGLLKYPPRPMRFTESLGVDLLVLSRREIDVLVTLRSNLMLTEAAMREDATNKDAFNLLAAQKIQIAVRNDLKLLAEAFAEFAPERKFTLGVGEPELASQLLTHLSQGETAKFGH